MIPETIMCCGQSGAQALTCQFECIRRLLYHVQLENLSFPLAQTTGLDLVKV
jgi:hypothetical protein